MPEQPSPAMESNGYERYFGLTESPFKLTASPRYLFESAAYLAAFKEIFYALSRREPIIVVTGPIGTGKTTLCRMLSERKDPRTLVAIISTPPQIIDDLFRQVLDGFDLLTDDTRSIVDASRYGLQRVFRKFLDSLAVLKAQAILVFDEAQRLPPEVLEEIRLLLNLDGDRQLLQIVLVGQPELDDLIARPELGPMEQRISRRHRLEPLALAEVSDYIDHRLRVAQPGQPANDAPTFTEAALGTIATLSRGVPRVVNILCDRSLEDAWLEKTHMVDAPAIERVARSLSIEVPSAVAPKAPIEPAPVTPARVEPKPVTPLPVTPRAVAPSFPTPSLPESFSGLSRNTSVRVKRSYVPVVIAAVVVGVVILVWMVRGGSIFSKDPNSAQQAEAARATASQAAPNAPAARGARGASASAARAREAAALGDTFMIAVSSFKTRDRATAVAADIVALGLPASVRSASGWEQVVVGPYSSRQDAIAAQSRLVTAHFADTKVTPAP